MARVASCDTVEDRVSAGGRRMPHAQSSDLSRQQLQGTASQQLGSTPPGMGQLLLSLCP